MDISHLVRKRVSDTGLHAFVQFCMILQQTDDKVNGDAKRWCKDDDTTPTSKETISSKADSSLPTQTAEL